MEGFFPGFEETYVKVGDVTVKVVYGGRGAPLLMLHGSPETHLMWHKVAPALAERYTLILPDLRGYGESSHPKGLPGHANYAKRVMGADQIALMEHLGYRRFYLVGHDRGARVAHRMMLDYPDAIEKCMLLDIVPTYDLYTQTNMESAIAFYHWFFLIQPDGLPERLLAGSGEAFIRAQFGEYQDRENCARIFPEEIRQCYVNHLATPEGIHSICEDYRAGATIDLEHDRLDRDKKIALPIHVLFGEQGNMNRCFDVLGEWRERGSAVTGECVPGCGHFIPEDAPEAVIAAIIKFFKE